jgi:hypothetical protein
MWTLDRSVVPARPTVFGANATVPSHDGTLTNRTRSVNATAPARPGLVVAAALDELAGAL